MSREGEGEERWRKIPDGLERKNEVGEMRRSAILQNINMHSTNNEITKRCGKLVERG